MKSLRLASQIYSPKLIGLLLIVILSPSAFGQVRRSTTYSSFINPIANSTISGTFRAGGIFSIAGGVVFDGRSGFYLEEGEVKHPIPATMLTLSTGGERSVTINYSGTGYRLEIIKGIACPLAKFVSRGGRVAYTIPFDDDAELALKEAGLVDSTIGDKVAKEFAGTHFEELLEAADFAKTIALPTAVKTQIMSNINQAVGGGKAGDDGSYINTDSQVTYQVYLMAGEGKVEISGVPLRYHWKLGPARSAVIEDVEVLSQSWGTGPKLTDFSRPGSEPTQYDIVSLFQTAGVFRQMRNTNRQAFSQFVAAVCAR